MDNQPENKSIQLDTDYENHAINMKFSNNLTDDRERGYILSAAFFSYCILSLKSRYVADRKRFVCYCLICVST